MPAADAVVHAILRGTLLLVHPGLCETLALLFETLLHLCGFIQRERERAYLRAQVRTCMGIGACIHECMCVCARARNLAAEIQHLVRGDLLVVCNQARPFALLLCDCVLWRTEAATLCLDETDKLL